MMVGQTIAHYRVVEKIGAGGMGEVYRARDERLDRDVALKVLPDSFARDPERLARFEREAKLLASLNHPHIAAIYGLEEATGQRFLVLELVEGETLAERVQRSSLPVEEALEVCRQVAEALEAAHEKGIIHRDLKPANVKVTPEGKVKVLDFGLAKALAGDPKGSDPGESPTLSDIASREGMILGTAAYMSPEQARGKAVDKRADIWAFGCVLYELLAGARAFGAETVTDTLAASLTRDPNWALLPPNAAPAIRRVLERCLQKDPRRRLHDIADARLELDEALAAPVWSRTAAVPGAPVRRWRWALPWTLMVLLVLALAVATHYRISPEPAVSLATKRFALDLGPEAFESEGQPVALSPDGTLLVYAASSEGAAARLYVRRMNELESTLIPGTENAHTPFFSPDGRWIGFFAEDKLKKVSLPAGSPVTISSAQVSFGATWGPDDTIVFAPVFGSGLAKLSARGGEAERLTQLNISEGERQHAWPQILSAGKAVLFTIATGVSFEGGRIAVQRLDTGERRILVEDGSYGRYLPSGHLMYVRSGSVLAAPFDLARLEVTGPAVPLVEGVRTGRYGEAYLAAADDGTLIYSPRAAIGSEQELVWVDRKGSVQPLAATKRAFALPRLSPNGQQLAVSINDEGNFSIWLYDLRRETFSRFTSEKSSAFPVWSPDGKLIAFSSNALGPVSIFRKPADSSAAAEPLTRSEYPQIPTSWSPDGTALLATEIHPTAAGDILLLSVKSERQPESFLATPNDEYNGMLSPDGRWLAYVSNESGQYAVYVRPFRGPGGRIQVSSGGGSEPLWAPNGRELFYRRRNSLMAVDVAAGPTFRAGKPKVVFRGNFDHGPDGMSNYDITPDGQRFVMVREVAPQAAAGQLVIVLHWFEELKRRVPTGK